MKIITSIDEMQKVVEAARINGSKIGFVPTMGFLHEGHLRLIETARKQNDVVVLSVFVNPLQFGPNEDFDAYPRDIKRDEELAHNSGVDFLFYPSSEEMYQKKMSVSVIVTERVNVLCGAQRKGHFDGVATVLVKLFNIVCPHRVYFGMKDAQQVAVVDGLIYDFNFPIELVAIETVRDEDGLAKSSRNVYLSTVERKEAFRLYESLQKAKFAIENGEKNPEMIKEQIKNHLKRYTSGKVDYVEIYQYPNLEPITTLAGKIIIAIAVKFTKARLIDNITFVVNQ